MKKFIFTLLIAMSLSSAIAKTDDTNNKVEATERVINIFKTQPKSQIFKSQGSGRQCVMACFQEYRKCLGSAGTGSGYWICELEMEQCTTNCLD